MADGENVVKNEAPHSKKGVIYSSDSEDESPPKRRRIRRMSADSNDDKENKAEEECDILELVGEPTPTENNIEINSKLATLWRSIMSKGLKEDMKKKIIEKIPTVKNCYLNSPTLNDEVKVTLSSNSKVRELKITEKQNQIGQILANLNKLLQSLIEKKDKENINILSDSMRLLCDLQYLESLTRRVTILPGLNKNLREALENTEIGECLFGGELHQVIKRSKDLEKSSKDLRRPANTNKNLNYWSPSTSTQYLPPQGGQRSGYLNKIRAAQKKFHRQANTAPPARAAAAAPAPAPAAAPAAAQWGNQRAGRSRRPAQQTASRKKD